MRSNENLADQVLPKPGTSKIGEHEVLLQVVRPGTPQTWHLRNRGNEVQRNVGRPGSPQTWYLKIEEYAGQHKNRPDT